MNGKVEEEKMGKFFRSWKGLSAFSLKIIAIISMIIDHFAVAIYLNLPGFEKSTYICLRYIGRIAFPIYCFLLVEGFWHTGNMKKYILRMAVMAILSEIPFDLVRTGQIWNLEAQNVYFTLCIGLIVLYFIHKNAGFTEKKIFIQVVVIALGALIANFADFDYHYMGVFTIVFFYYVRMMISPWLRDIMGAAFLMYDIPASLAMIPIHLYNGKRGFDCKVFFYFIYPVHLLIFGLIRIFWL